MRRFKSAVGRSALWSLVVVLAVAACVTSEGSQRSKAPVNVIFDTDLGGDVDDVGALAMLNVLANRGEAHVLAVISSNPLGTDAAVTIAAINEYYGNGKIPIGLREPGAPFDEMANTSAYASLIARSAAYDRNGKRDFVPATQLYRRILASQPDGSVVIVVTGGETNLGRLLDSPPDQYSSMTGTELVGAKVSRLVAMGGRFPEGQEWNMMLDPSSGAQVATFWPTPVLYSGFDVGANVSTGATLSKDLSRDNPVRVAYESYLGAGKSRESWDQTAIYVSVRGEQHLFGVSVAGSVNVDPKGNTAFTARAGGERYYLDKTASDSDIAAAIEAIMAASP